MPGTRESMPGTDNMTSQASLEARPNSRTRLRGGPDWSMRCKKICRSFVMAESNPPIAFRENMSPKASLRPLHATSQARLSTHKAVRETTLGADNMTSQASLGARPNSCTQLQGGPDWSMHCKKTCLLIGNGRVQSSHCAQRGIGLKASLRPLHVTSQARLEAWPNMCTAQRGPRCPYASQ